jgi:hypothetical protein
MTGSTAVSRKNASRPIGLTVGQRVLFNYHPRRPAQWVVGVIIGGPRSKRERMTYQVKLDNGEIRWGAANQFRKAEL